MNETQTQPPSGARQKKAHSPEYDFGVRVLSGLRQDLVQDAFAYRPLPPAGTGGAVIGRLPRRIRAKAIWLPHAVVTSLALIVFLIGWVGGDSFAFGLFGGLDGIIPMIAVLLTLVRPLGAFWLSLAATPLLGALADSWDGWPWAPGSFAGHLVVLTVVALRTRPRATAWMYALTCVYGIFTSLALTRMGGSDAPQMLFFSGVILLCVTLRHIRREAQQEVTAERHVTAVERSRRTLLEERTTIARELHDVVAHHMSVVAIQAEAAPYRVENPPPELEQAFVTIRENAVAALAELRRVLGVVRAEDYEAPDAPQPTLADLESLIGNVRDAGLTVERVVTGAVRELPQGVELSAYRIVQEALSNVLRHAPGGSARVELGYVLGGLGLRIVNTAPTGPVQPSPGAGHGITGMRERVSMLDGDMTAGLDGTGGYEVAVFLPVAAEPVAEPDTGRAGAEQRGTAPGKRGTSFEKPGASFEKGES